MKNLILLGSTKARVQTCGKEKTRLSVCFTATASGIKLKTLCVVPRKREIKGLSIDNDFLIVYDTDGNT